MKIHLELDLPLSDKDRDVLVSLTAISPVSSGPIKRTVDKVKAAAAPKEDEKDEKAPETPEPTATPRKRSAAAKKAEKEPEPTSEDDVIDLGDEDEDEEAEEEEVTMADAIAYAQTLVAKNKGAVIRKVLKAFGATKVKEIPESDAGKFLAALKAGE